MKYWSVINEIQKQVDREANKDWSKTTTPSSPKVEIKDFKKTAGYYHFIRTLIRELRP